jgi:hypothetical protein
MMTHHRLVLQQENELNRYYGFYFDSLIIKRYTFYNSIELVESVLVEDLMIMN